MHIKDFENIIEKYILSSKCDKEKLTDNGFLNLTKRYLYRRNLWEKKKFLEVEIDKVDDACRIHITNPNGEVSFDFEKAYKALKMALDSLVDKDILEEIE